MPRRASCSITHQIDSNVHLQLMQKPCHVPIGLRPDIVKLIEGVDETGTHIALIVLAIGYTEHLKASPIMKLK